MDTHLIRKNRIRELLSELNLAVQEYEAENASHRGLDKISDHMVEDVRNLLQSDQHWDFEARGLDTLLPYNKPVMLRTHFKTDLAISNLSDMEVLHELGSHLMQNVILTEYNESVTEQHAKLELGQISTEEYNMAVTTEFTRRIRNLYPNHQSLADRVIATVFANDHRVLNAMIEDHRSAR